MGSGPDSPGVPLPEARPAGLKLALLGLAMGLAAVNTGNNLIYLMLSMMLALACVGSVAARRAMKRARPTAHLPREVRAGEGFVIRFEVIGRFPLLPNCRLRVRLDGLPSIVTREVCIDSRSGRGIGSAGLSLPRRGIHEGLTVSAASEYPFALATHRTRPQAAGSLVVLPDFTPIRSLRVAGTAPRPAASTLLAARGACGAGNELQDLREYAPEDDARHIDWRSSARTGRLMVRQFEREDPHRRIDLVIDTTIDTDGDAAGRDAAFESVVSRCAAILDFATRHHCDAFLWIPGRAAPLRGGAALRWLAGARPSLRGTGDGGDVKGVPGTPRASGDAGPGGPSGRAAAGRPGERIVVSADPARCTPLEVR